MSGGPKRNPDRLNTIGVVVVGVCGAVLVYVTIVALQAFYMDDTADVQTMADYGGNDIAAATVRATQVNSLNTYETNAASLDPQKQTFRMPVSRAMDKIVEAMKDHPERARDLVPGVAESGKPSSRARALNGRLVKLETGSAAAPGSGSAPAPGDGSSSSEPEPEPEPGPGSGSAAPAPATGSGSAAPAPATGSAQPQKAGSAAQPPKATGATGSGR